MLHIIHIPLYNYQEVIVTQKPKIMVYYYYYFVQYYIAVVEERRTIYQINIDRSYYYILPTCADNTNKNGYFYSEKDK